MNATQKVSQYLIEARASEDALVRILQSQIAMTPTGSYRSALETHLAETRRHSDRLARRIGELDPARGPVTLIVGFAEALTAQTLALAKTPLDLLRGSGGEEKVLKNAKDAAATEALEIATYTALERLAQSVGDADTAGLAQSIRADEEQMLERILQEIPKLADAVSRAELEHDPSYDVTRTGAADAVRRAGDTVQETADKARVTARRAARGTRRVPGVAQAEGQIKGAVADEDALPIARYDELTADEVTAQLPGLSQLELAEVDSYERRHESRTTVLSRLETLRGDEPWPGYDELNVSEVKSALADCDEERVRRTRAYESSHKHRSGVLSATERHLAKA